MNAARVLYYLQNFQEFQFVLAIKYPKLFSDKRFLKVVYRQLMGSKLNLECPRTFNEKIQWLKLYDRNPKYTQMVDKYEAKKYVADIIGNDYIIPALAVYDSTSEINLDALPDRFVLKCTHDSGSVAICKDKRIFQKEKAFAMLNKGLKRNFFWENREWPYKNVKPRIIAEAYLEDNETQELRDYKFFCFDGKVKALYIAEDRQGYEETKFDFFDADFRHLDIRNGHPNANTTPAKPQTFEKMKEMAEKLSQNIPLLRVDFYEANGKIYFGELTFSHMSGFTPFEPEKWDIQFGQWLKLPDLGSATSEPREQEHIKQAGKTEMIV